MDNFFNLVAQTYPLPNKIIQQLLKKAKTLQLQKGEIFPNKHPQFIIVIQGAIKTYMIDENQKEIIISIRFVNNTAFIVRNLAENQLSSKIHKTLVDTTILTIPISFIDKHQKKHPEINDFLLETLYHEKKDLMNAYINLLSLKPYDRFFKTLEQHPNLLHLINDDEWASLLGIKKSKFIKIKNKYEQIIQSPL